MKNNRASFITSTDGLSEKQMNFRAKGKPTIKEIVYTIAEAEAKISEEIRAIMDRSANPEQRNLIEISDNDIPTVPQQPIAELVLPVAKKFNSAEAAIKSFLSSRNSNIKYLRNSTEDLRNHVAQSSVGWIDCYQRYLLLVEQSNRLLWEIENIKLAPGFPNK